MFFNDIDFGDGKSVNNFAVGISGNWELGFYQEVPVEQPPEEEPAEVPVEEPPQEDMGDNGHFYVAASESSVPVPGALALMLLGIAGLGVARRAKRRL